MARTKLWRNSVILRFIDYIDLNLRFVQHFCRSSNEFFRNGTRIILLLREPTKKIIIINNLKLKDYGN